MRDHYFFFLQNDWNSYDFFLYLLSFPSSGKKNHLNKKKKTIVIYIEIHYQSGCREESKCDLHHNPSSKYPGIMVKDRVADDYNKEYFQKPKDSGNYKITAIVTTFIRPTEFHTRQNSLSRERRWTKSLTSNWGDDGNWYLLGFSILQGVTPNNSSKLQSKATHIGM